MAALALFGKHPALGDFVQRGLGTEEAAVLTGWLDPCLAAAKAQAGDDWQALWDGARALRFWWGRALLGRTVAGVMVPSRDKVGRRYPLVLAVLGLDVPMPLAATDQHLWERLEEMLASAEGPGKPELAALDPDGLGLADETEAMLNEGPTVWAHRPGGDLAALLQEAGPVDAARAATTRSYWWHPGRDGGPAAYLGQNGWPDGGALCWLLASGQRPAPALQEAADVSD